VSDLPSRRAFLRAAIAAGAAWTTVDLSQVEEALAMVATHAAGGAYTFSALTPAEAETIDAIASRILPSVDGRPGAHEARAVYFVDRALCTFNSTQRKLYTDGVAHLDRRSSRLRKGMTRFVALTAAEQDQLLHKIEKTRFFQAVRFDTIVGTFALPTWGGNQGFTGWQMLRLTHQPAFGPPFGFYDADSSR
jgi:gluconate 2-dehydrogenase gamma chain